jgi:o-succinylbenzoate---CoA ligase
LTRAARRWPERVAVATPERSVSYRELERLAARGAGELGAASGSRVGIALAPGLDFIVALHACLRAGAVAVPLDLRDPSSAERLAAGTLVIDRPLRCEAAPVAGVDHDLAAPALIVRTSGSTGEPKEVPLTYGNFLWSALGSAVALGLDPAERWLCTLPLVHVGGLSIVLRSAIYGTTAVVHERFETDRVLHALREQEVTLVSLVATTLARLLDAGLERPPRLRAALTGGGPVPVALVERARAARVPVSMTYGLTETCSQVTTTPAAALALGDFAAGPPLFCTRVRCAEDGEIMVAGPTVAPDATGPDGWLATGDVGALDERGRLQVTGRKADTIVSGGENVAPSEVEAVLEAHPDVLEAAVVGLPDERWGEAVTAIVVSRPGSAPDCESLRAHCAVALAPFKVPKRVLLRGEPLPRTRSGKLLRRELR